MVIQFRWTGLAFKHIAQGVTRSVDACPLLRKPGKYRSVVLIPGNDTTFSKDDARIFLAMSCPGLEQAIPHIRAVHLG